LKPARAKFARPYLEKNPSQKRAGGVAQDVGLESKPQYCKKKVAKAKRARVWLK
jgi:transposase